MGVVVHNVAVQNKLFVFVGSVLVSGMPKNVLLAKAKCARLFLTP